MLTRSRKAFTLLELIVVIVILGVLAALALPTFSAVIARARQANAEQAARSFDREVRALAAFDEGDPQDYIDDATSDATDGDVTVTTTSVAGKVSVAAGGGTACIQINTDQTPGDIVAC